jgi:hypothetical protein
MSFIAKLFRKGDTGRNNMDLKEFVEQTLVQISEGIAAANNSLKERDRDPTTHFLLYDGKNEYDKKTDEPSKISFDVAVTTTSNVKGSVSAKSKLFVVDAGVNGSVAREKQSVSRVKFEVCVNKNVGLKPIADSPSYM